MKATEIQIKMASGLTTIGKINFITSLLIDESRESVNKDAIIKNIREPLKSVNSDELNQVLNGILGYFVYCIKNDMIIHEVINTVSSAFLSFLKGQKCKLVKYSVYLK